jgi:hypothetical protein
MLPSIQLLLAFSKQNNMTQATLIIHNEDGTEAYHAHSSSDDLMDILIQFEDQIIEYGDSKDNETYR